MGKTTLACNYAHYCATTDNKRVIVIDLDPQANASQLLLSDEQWCETYDSTTGATGESTILKAFSHILEGDSTVSTSLTVQNSKRFSVGVIAGHPFLSRVEDQLSQSWMDLRGAQPAGARKTNWLTVLRASLEADLVIIDLGPSLGALNRSAILGSSNFVTPVAADLFSLYALENIGDWMGEWLDEYSDAFKRTCEKNPAMKSLENLPTEPMSAKGYIGYTIQQYVAKRTGGGLRPTAAYDRYKNQIPEKVSELKKYSSVDEEHFSLGIVPNMFSMIPLAQTAHAPITALESRDGVRGAQVYQQSRYAEDLADIFKRISVNMGLVDNE